MAHIIYMSRAKTYCSAFINGQYFKLEDEEVRFLTLIGYNFAIFCDK
jgi:hypothetical protein